MPPLPTDLDNPHLRAVLDSLPSGVTLADREGSIVFSNAAADRLLGVDATSAPPDEWADHYGVFLPDGVTPFPTEAYPLVRALEGVAVDGQEMLIRNASTPEGRLISVSGQPLQDVDGEIVGACVVFRDVTELRRAQKESALLNERLAEALRAREEYSAFLVHDFKNPIGAIVALSEVLLGDTATDSESHRDLAEIHESAWRLHRMVLDLLDIDVAENGEMVLTAEDVGVESLIDEVRATVSARVRASGQQLQVGMHAGAATLFGDRSLLQRVVANLVDNCLKYGPRGGAIRLEAHADEELVRIDVADEGPGVPDAYKLRIFDKYSRVERDEAGRAAGSRGLGLRFCRLAVEAHGGRIWVEDAQPRGARFSVSLPLRARPDPDRRA